MYLRGSELERGGDHTRAESWLTRAADAGHSLAIVAMDRLLRGLDRAADADAQLRARAEHIPYAMFFLALNHPDRAERKTLMERAAAAGETAAMKALADEGHASRQSDQAEAWLERAIQAGDTWALRTILKWHEDEIERGERIEYFLERAATCRADELWELAERFDEAGLAERVDAHFRRAAEQGDTLAQVAYAQRLWRTERQDEAESWWRRALENGAGFAIDGLEEALKEVKRSKEAKALRRFGIEPGGRTGKFDVDRGLLTFLGVGGHRSPAA
jgi:TPR repeat protein